MKRFLVAFIWLLLLVVVAMPVVLWVGSYFSLDHNFAHTKHTQSLERFTPSAAAGSAPKLQLIDAGGMTFRARTAGFGGKRGNVVLLHGFPETSAMYEPMLPVLAEAGYQVVAFDQRGYSPTMRPRGSEAYTMDQLTADVFAVADALEFDRFHLVGHDWGAVVGWSVVFGGSPRVQSWSALSIPHMGAYSEALQKDADQRERSAYLGFFRTPWLPEAVFSFNGFAMMKRAVYSEHDKGTLGEYLRVFSEPGALTAALSWYRAVNIASSPELGVVGVPTAFIWGNADPVVGDLSLVLQRDYFDGNLWETELDTGHWLMESHPEAVTLAVLEHFARTH